MLSLFLMAYLFGVICGIIFVILAMMGYCKFGNKIIIGYGIQKRKTKINKTAII